MKVRGSILVVGILTIGMGACRQPFPKFEKHTIDNWGKALGQTALVDLDHDGDLDWISGCASHAKEFGSAICWWEFIRDDKWIRHEMGTGDTDVGGAAYDVNNDGWIDFVSGSKLLLHPGIEINKRFYEFDIGTIYSHDSEFADVNGDGQIDLIANHDQMGLVWYEIADDPTNEWKAHEIASSKEYKVHGGVSPKSVGDLNGDGNPDIVTARVWYENLGGGLRWEPHNNIDFGEVQKYGIAVRTWVGDMDLDGDLDIVQSEADHPDGRVAWFENDGTGNWTKHLVRDSGQRQDWHSLAVADFDNDGDQDIYAGAGPLSSSGDFGIYIWENENYGMKWIEHLIVSGYQCHEVEFGDVDGDGDIDICTKPWKGSDEHIYLENKLIVRK